MATLLSYWQSLASRLGDWGTFSSSSVSADASTIIATALIDSSVGLDRYAYHYVYALDGALTGSQRVVTKNGFENTTGTLTVSRAFSSTPQSGVTWAMLERFPAIQHDRTPGLREFVNLALSDLSIHDFITVHGRAGQIRYPLSKQTNWWIGDPNRVLNVWQPYPTPTDRRMVDRQDWDLLIDGETPVLQLRNGYAASDTFEIEVRRPANSRLNLNGAWEDQADPLAGLHEDTDEAIPSLNAVVSVALTYAFETMVNNPGLAQAIPYLEAKLKTQQREAEVYKMGAAAPPAAPLYFRGASLGAFR